MPGGAYPKPDAERRNRNAPAFGWTELDAAGREGDAPDLPPGREWPSATATAWADLWKTPQATAWDQTGRTLHRWAWLHADLVVGKGASNTISAEMRQLEDRHGLSPKAMLQLRWRVKADDDASPPTALTKPKSSAAKRSRMKVLDGGAG